MKDRKRWKSEEDELLCAYVKLYGPREWNLISQRMNVTLNRDAKSCLERWKNYLRPGIKRGSLTEEEQRLVIQLQAKHGNKWKKIASEIPGRTAKRLGKWWEVFKEKQQQALKHRSKNTADPLDVKRYDRILENFAEKLVKERPNTTPYIMAAPLFPPWLSNSNASSLRSPSPSVTLTLSPTPLPPAYSDGLQGGRPADNGLNLPGLQQEVLPGGSLLKGRIVSELVDCCRELEDGHRAWLTHKKEAAWRLRRVELQLESEKACRRRDKVEEMEAKIRVLKEEQQIALERIEAEYREHILVLRRDAETKEQKLAEEWATKHIKLTKFLEQMGNHHWPASEINGR